MNSNTLPSLTTNVTRSAQDAKPSIRDADPGTPRPLYTPLNVNHNEIRLIRLLPSNISSSPIQCMLATVSLSTNLPYNALSYVWSDQKGTVPISVNGTPFNVTRNLYTTLKYLRRDHEDLILWVDAICINQSDIPERNAQVPRMGSTFEGAQETLVWLGEDDCNAGLGFNLIEMWPKQDENEPGFPSTCIRENPGLFDPAACESLASLSRLEWWHRAWTFREFVVSPSVTWVCGKNAITWETVSSAASV